MSTLDRYIIRNFLYCYLLCLLVLMGLRIVADLFLNMDEFAKLGMSSGQLIGHVAGYYAYQTLEYFQELGGIIAVAGAAFALARMNYSNELTAILASGVSLHRVILPVIIVGMAMSGLSVANQELVIPRVKQHLVRNPDDVPGLERFPIRLINDTARNIWFSKEFVAADSRMVSPLVFLRDSTYKKVAQLSAAECFYDGHRRPWRFLGGSLVIPGRDVLSTTRVATGLSPAVLAKSGLPDAGGRVRLGDTGGELIVSADRVDAEHNALVGPAFEVLSPELPPLDQAQRGTLAVIQADSAQYVAPNSQQPGGYALTNGRILLQTDLTPNELALRQTSRWLEFLSTPELNRLLQAGKVADVAGANMAKHVRFTDPLANLILLVVGLPFILSRERNIKASAGLFVLTVALCFVGIVLFRYCGGYGLNPVLAAWLPILIFGPAAVAMADSVKT